MPPKPARKAWTSSVSSRAVGGPNERFATFAARHRLKLRQLYVLGAVADFADTVRGRAEKGIPSKRLRAFIGDEGDFTTIGQELLDHCRNLGGLQPTDRVLDVGSGIGRVALPLTGYLSPEGSYDGLEIVRVGVRWCTDNLTSRHGNVRFHHADIYHQIYNPQGQLEAQEFRFPFEGDSFDFAVVTSVFTHMLFATVDRYLGELSRIVAQGGHVLATFFILNDQSRALLAAGRSAIPFAHEVDSPRGNGDRSCSP